MKYTETEADKILDKLIASTHSPRGRYSAAESYKLLEKRLPRKIKRILPLHIWRTVISVAAILLISLIGWCTYEYLVPLRMQTINTLATCKEIVLPDGSQIILNHFSSLTYPKRFKGGNREVILNGEGFFNITKDTKHPFIVTAEMVKVQVLGTKFNIDAYSNNPEVKTTLVEGSVMVSIESINDQIILQPNESAIYNKENKTLELATSNETIADLAWQNSSFIFDKQTLQEIARKLSNSFGVMIEIDDNHLANYRLTAKFNNNESLEEILTLLQTGRDFTFKKMNNQKIIISRN